MSNKIKLILLASTFIGGSLVKADGLPIEIDENKGKELLEKGIAKVEGQEIKNSNNGLAKLESDLAEKDKDIEVLIIVNEDLSKELEDLKAENEKLKAENVALSDVVSNTDPKIVNKKLTGK
jgi:hypothetical protein